MRVSACVLAFLAAASVRAEVSVDRHPDGSITAYFVPGSQGPWEPLRPEIATVDILNAQGDLVGDAWPIVFDNRALGRPEAVWASAGEDADIFSSHHDGEGWTERARLSQPSGADTLPNESTDKYGNRFVVWDRHRNGRHSVQFTALAGDDSGQTPVEEMSSRPRQGHAPCVAAADDGFVWVAYDEAVSPSDSTIAVAVDRVDVPRQGNGSVSCGGEVPIDIARSGTFVTHRAEADGSADARMNAEAGEVWVTWVDSAVNVGYSQLVDGAFGPIHYRGYSNPSEIPGIRAGIRNDIVGP